jgi:hypothetical protein
MGMGAAPCHTQVITSEVIEQIVPVEYKRFIEACEKVEIDLDSNSECYALHCLKDDEYQELRVDLDDECSEEAIKELIDAYNALLESFSEKTDMPININHTSEDSGGRYDDVDGVFWEIGNVYQLTPLAKQLKEQYGEYAIKDAGYTVWC